MSKIYIASSWKNKYAVLTLACVLRQSGHEVFAFCERNSGHFVFDAHDWRGRDLSTITVKQGFRHPAFRKAFQSDKAGLDWANTVVLLLPSGRSSHLEAGYAAGQGKNVFVLGAPIAGDFDVMYGFAKAVCETTSELLRALRV